MAKIDDALEAALKSLPPKPSDSAKAPIKKRYSEQLSQTMAVVIGSELRNRGLKEARPTAPGELDSSGAERRMAGGIGAKKVDVTWATEESGLLLAISIKSINFKDGRGKNYQKNLTNRRGDILMEAVTLHRRFPYAVLGGLFFFDKGAASDDTKKRRSTFLNAHARFKLFTGRGDPAGRDEQYERFYIILVEASPSVVYLEAFEAGKPGKPVPFSQIFDELLSIAADRNPDFYEYDSASGQLLVVP